MPNVRYAIKDIDSQTIGFQTYSFKKDALIELRNYVSKPNRKGFKIIKVWVKEIK